MEFPSQESIEKWDIAGLFRPMTRVELFRSPRVVTRDETRARDVQARDGDGAVDVSVLRVYRAGRRPGPAGPGAAVARAAQGRHVSALAAGSRTEAREH